MRARRAMRRKRRAMWDSAKTKRRSPQPMFHDEDAGLRRTGGVYNPRVPQDRTRAPQERTRASREERPRVPQSGRRVPSSARRPRPHQARRSRAPGSRPDERERERRLRKCWPGSPAARRRDRNGSGGYFSSWRCSLRTNSVRPVRRSRLSRSALRIDCTSANASSTLWLTTI